MLDVQRLRPATAQLHLSLCHMRPLPVQVPNMKLAQIHSLLSQILREVPSVVIWVPDQEHQLSIMQQLSYLFYVVMNSYEVPKEYTFLVGKTTISIEIPPSKVPGDDEIRGYRFDEFVEYETQENGEM